MADLPTGTVTFLLTDVEGSTRLWDSHPREAGTILARHDALIESAALARGGTVVRPRGEGDSRFVVFSRATDAVAAALDIQRAFSHELWTVPIEVRIALHTGEADVRDGDYYGGAPNRCARLRALARGGQTLVSRATHDLVADAMPDGISLRDLGQLRLRDLARPEHVFQLCDSDPADDRVRHGSRTTERPARSGHPLIGRSAELALLRSALQEAARGNGRVGLIEGEAGIGKSRLLSDTLDVAQTLHFEIAFARAHELERDRPFGPLIDALGLGASSSDPLRSEIAQLLAESPGQRGTPSRTGGAHFGIVERIVDLVESLAVRRSLVLAVEDLHWGDLPTIHTLHRLAARIRDLPVALVCTTRPIARGGELQSLLAELDAGGAIRVSLGPLEADAVGELIRATLGAPPGPRLLAKAQGAAGNPLFITELLSALEHDQLIQTSDGVAEVEEATLPPSLALTVLQRLAFLSEPALEVLRLASALGTEFSLRDVASVMGKAASDLFAAIDEAMTAGLIGETEGRLAFRHDLVRDAIYEDMLLPIRKALHTQIAEALSAAGAPVTRIATHVALGAERGDMHAIDVLQAAANETLARAPQVAAGLLERALELVDGSDRRTELECALGTAQLVGDRPVVAERIARDVLSRAATHGARTMAVRLLAKGLLEQGKWRESAEIIDPWVHDPSVPASEQARWMAESAWVRHMFDRERSVEEAEQAIALGQETGDATSVFIATVVLGTCRGLEGRIKDAMELYDRAGSMAGEVDEDEPAHRNHVRLRRLMLIYDDRFDEASSMLAAVRDAADVGSLAVNYHFDLAHILAWSGRWDEAVVEAESGVEVTEAAGKGWELDLLRQFLIFIAIHRDELDAAEAHLTHLPSAMWTRALLAEARGDDAGVKAILDTYRPHVENPRPWYVPQMWWVGPDWVRLYLGAGDQTSARTITDVLETSAALARTPTAEGAALRSRGLVEGDASLLVRAVEAYRAGPRAFDRALACEDAGIALAETAPDDGIALLEEAMAVYESTGAIRDIARVDAGLRALGVRRGRRGPRRRPKAGWASLTETELRISSLVEEGLTYREIGQRLFISKRTVETHVTHVFGKLGLSARRELADAVRSHRM